MLWSNRYQLIGRRGIPAHIWIWNLTQHPIQRVVFATKRGGPSEQPPPFCCPCRRALVLALIGKGSALPIGCSMLCPRVVPIFAIKEAAAAWPEVSLTCVSFRRAAASAAEPQWIARIPSQPSKGTRNTLHLWLLWVCVLKKLQKTKNITRKLLKLNGMLSDSKKCWNYFKNNNFLLVVNKKHLFFYTDRRKL